MKLRRELGSPKVRDIVEAATARARELPDKTVRDPWPENARRLSAVLELDDD